MESPDPEVAANVTFRLSRCLGDPAPHLDLPDFDQEDQWQKVGNEDPQHQDEDKNESFLQFAKHEEQEICVTGAAATKTPRKGSKSPSASLSSGRRPSSIAKKSPSFAIQKTDRRRSNCGNNNDEDAAMKRQWELEVERLHEDAARWKRELEHVRDEKTEIEEAFRRLDREIANGYNLTERKEKELKIAELVTKNQKIAQLLEKELKVQGELRVSNAQLLSQNQSQQEQLDLLNSVLSTLETKHSSLSDAHVALKTTFNAAQLTIERLQESVNEMQTRLIHSGNQQQRFQEYEHKIEVWERKYVDMERKFTNRDQKVHVLTQEIESLLENRASLEKEVDSAHDQMIRMNAMMKTLEAKIEANLQSEQARSDTEKVHELHERIRMLKGELFQKSRAYADLRQNFDEFLSGATGRKPSSKAISGRNSFSTQIGASRLKVMASRVAALTEKLQFAEDLRERKTRSLDVMMQAFPYLLQQLDALQDKFLAAAESNEILKSALEQIQQQTPLENALEGGTRGYSSIAGRCQAPTHVLSSEMYLRLVREKYILSAPYQIDLLTGYTDAMAFTDHPSHSAATATATATATASEQHKVKKFPPFRVVSMVKRTDNNLSDDGDGDKEDSALLAIVADANDASGASYLNRSKINAFLQFIQGKAAKKKFKEIVFTKLAELITKLREIKLQFAAELTAQRATIQMLQREVDELKHRLKSSSASGTHWAVDAGTNNSNSVASLSRRKLLMKLIDLYGEKQQQHRQSTFLTQTTSSDVLISNALTLESCERDTFDISDCSIEDDDLSEVLLKIQVSGVNFHEIRFDSNALSDSGAQYLANFFEKCPSGIKVVSVDGNSAISYHGIEALKRGLLRNPWVHRIETDPSGQVVDALAAQGEYEILGRPTVVLRVFLPKASRASAKLHSTHASEEDVDRMMDRIHQMGFSDLFPRKTAPPASFSIYSAAAGEGRKKRGASNGGRSTSVSITSSAASRRQTAVRTQQEHKLHRLEAAIKRATTSTSAATPSHSRNRATPSRSRLTSSSRQPPTRSNVNVPLLQSFAGVPLRSSTFSSSCAIYSNTHLATVRGLKR